MHFIKHSLTGVGQIFLQNNALSGAIIVIGMLFSHWALAFGCLAGSFIGTLMAYSLRFPSEQIKQGLYGFNASLAMICVLFSLGLTDLANPLIWLIGMLCCLLSTLIMRLFLIYDKVALTFPFVLTCWIVVGSIGFYQPFGLTLSMPDLPDYTDAYHAVMMPFFAWAEVNFGSSLMTGLLLCLAIAINNPAAAMWATGSAVVATVAAALLFDIETNVLANGLYGYCAILISCVFYGSRFCDFCYTMVAVVLSVVIQYYTLALGLPAYTFGFIAATWVVLHLKNRLASYFKSNHSNSLASP